MEQLHLDNYLQGKQNTSQKAYHKAVKKRAPAIRDKIIEALKVKPMTGYELCELLDLRFCSVRPRLADLSRKYKKIEPTGEERKNGFGNNELVWQLTSEV